MIRIEEMGDMFTRKQSIQCASDMKIEEFLQKNNIRYIYLPKIYEITLDTGKLFIKRIFENDEVEIFQVID